jgi:hypothetical protein
MNKLAVCLGLALLLSSAALAADGGASSKQDLANLYQRYFTAKDQAKLSTLVYWPGVMQRERDAFNRSLSSDLQYRLKKAGFVELDKNQTLEYTLGGTVFRPTLPAVGRLVATYEDQGAAKNLSTTYLVGVKDNRYYITLASPVPK